MSGRNAMPPRPLPMSRGTEDENAIPKILLLHDGAAGHASQVRGLATALGWPATEQLCRLRFPWSCMPGTTLPNSPTIFLGNELRNLPRPDLVISCGRQAAPGNLWMRQRWGCYSIHLQNPHVPLNYFDLVVPPEHDQLHGPNVFATQGALHPLTQSLEVETQRPRAESLRSLGEFAAVLLGGPNRYYPFSRQDIQSLAGRLKRVSDCGFRLAVIASRRTPQTAIQILREQLGPEHLVWDGGPENPYRSALAHCSHVIVTGDSVSMISEACSTGKPVYVEFLSQRRVSSKFGRFHQSFLDAGRVRPFVGNLDQWTAPRLDEASRIADVVREYVDDRTTGWPLRAAG